MNKEMNEFLVIGGIIIIIIVSFMTVNTILKIINPLIFLLKLGMSVIISFHVIYLLSMNYSFFDTRFTRTINKLYTQTAYKIAKNVFQEFFKILL